MSPEKLTKPSTYGHLCIFFQNISVEDINLHYPAFDCNALKYRFLYRWTWNRFLIRFKHVYLSLYFLILWRVFVQQIDANLSRFRFIPHLYLQPYLLFMCYRRIMFSSERPTFVTSYMFSSDRPTLSIPYLFLVVNLARHTKICLRV